MSDYAARERELLKRLAWATLYDPKASDADKRAASERVDSESDEKQDWSLLSRSEWRLLEALYDKAEGKPATVIRPQLDELHRIARSTQVAADDARLELDAGPQTYNGGYTTWPHRCPTCDRYIEQGYRPWSADDREAQAQHERAQASRAAYLARLARVAAPTPNPSTTNDVVSVEPRPERQTVTIETPFDIGADDAEA